MSSLRDQVRDSVREQPLPGETEAEARAWRVLEAALAERETSADSPAAAGRARSGRTRRGLHPRRVALRLALVAVLVAAGLLVALTPAGAEMGDWIEDRFTKDSGRESRPSFADLPKGGSVLALTRAGAYAVRPDGGTQWLGSFSEAGWSPRGLHAIGVDGRRLIAVDPTGTPKWTLAGPRRVHHPAWSLGEGFWVAYLAADPGRPGSVLRAVDGRGDPTTDKRLRRRAAAVTPAWRPGPGYVMTYATAEPAAGAVETLDAVSGRRLWRAQVGAPVESLAWSRDGRRLVALSSQKVTVLSRGGRVLRTLALPAVASELALHPSGRRAAVVVGARGEQRVVELPLVRDGGDGSGTGTRQLFQGDVDGLAWSRDGRHLLLAWRDTGQWLLMGPGRRIRALDEVARELGAVGGFPRIAGWCCPG